MDIINPNLSHLNQKQQVAVLSESKQLLVLAGAGSGKTKTLLQKLLYLIEEKEVSPNHILTITFGKETANEMLDRLLLATDETGAYSKVLTDPSLSKKEKDLERHFFIKKYKWIDNLTLKTFHSFCYQILRNYGVKEFDNKFKIINDNSKKDEFLTTSATESATDVLHKIIIEECANSEYLLDLKRYVLDYLSYDLRKKKNNILNTYEESKKYISLNGTKVRSKSEQYIADWLYRHNIVFKYEKPTNLTGDFDFKPDFFIPEADIYLEHVSEKSYPSKQKEAQYKKTNRVLEKTFEKQAQDTALFNLELDRIVKGRLPSNYHYKVSLSFEEEFKNFNKEIKDFINLAMSVMHKAKVENQSPEKLYTKSQTDQHERVRKFYQLAIPIIEKYQEYCTNKSYMDFDDLISKTISLLKNQKDIKEKFQQQYKYILVDEFQDVNTLQVELLKQLHHSENQLFCVGDDWQSIYGFRGSNVDYIVNFSDYFPEAKTIKLNLNYRSTEHIVNAGNEVIANNKFKIEKEIISSKKSDSKIHIYSGNTEEDNVDFLVDQIQQLQQEKEYKNDDILILYRSSKMYYPYQNRLKKEGIFISRKSIHASKGLEAKAVFVIGMTSGLGGFPDVRMGDRIFQVIKPSNHDLLMEEERRLFYVAITRAKDELFLITEKGNESPFLKEIPNNVRHNINKPLRLLNPEKKLCQSCNHQINEKFLFCPHCGENQ
ncbi:UvrD-helicase domain-containing protein [Aquimarina algicola]|uniref:UvrD-helicase domain-containing protein n=1 Tax=Aquimarina algicola TaxID=2589995 RepID=UPI001CF1B702|nr:UvrD-helicase domain-containing protein [Aquimarina algicola]